MRGRSRSRLSWWKNFAIDMLGAVAIVMLHFAVFVFALWWRGLGV